MPSTTGYRTSFPTRALPGSKGVATGAERVGYALPGGTKRKKQTAAGRRKKRTGYAYEPVGRPLPRKKSRAKKQFSGVRGKHSSTASAAYQKALAAEEKRQAKEAARMEASSGTAKAKKAAAKVADKAANVVATAVGRAIFPPGRAGAAQRAKTAAKITGAVKGVLANPAVKAAAKATGVLAAGAAAYGITRSSRLGGKGGDAVVAAYFKRKDRSEQARLRAFRDAVAAERRLGPVSSARVKALANTFGLSTTGAR